MQRWTVKKRLQPSGWTIRALSWIWKCICRSIRFFILLIPPLRQKSCRQWRRLRGWRKKGTYEELKISPSERLPCGGMIPSWGGLFVCLWTFAHRLHARVQNKGNAAFHQFPFSVSFVLRKKSAKWKIWSKMQIVNQRLQFSRLNCCNKREKGCQDERTEKCTISFLQNKEGRR